MMGGYPDAADGDVVYGSREAAGTKPDDGGTDREAARAMYQDIDDMLMKAKSSAEDALAKTDDHAVRYAIEKILKASEEIRSASRRAALPPARDTAPITSITYPGWYLANEEIHMVTSIYKKHRNMVLTFCHPVHGITLKDEHGRYTKFVTTDIVPSDDFCSDCMERWTEMHDDLVGLEDST
ncbi:MAG: hypothetical protein MPK62_00115 [Alphaproteobacteria bacterium]|nr:hypothetical protein [Alphaproteobacteria bacterium]MDA8029541.1 hypothetical protein [Alphaproteobacteria bacterium]